MNEEQRREHGQDIPDHVGTQTRDLLHAKPDSYSTSLIHFLHQLKSVIAQKDQSNKWAFSPRNRWLKTWTIKQPLNNLPPVMRTRCLLPQNLQKYFPPIEKLIKLANNSKEQLDKIVSKKKKKKILSPKLTSRSFFKTLPLHQNNYSVHYKHHLHLQSYNFIPQVRA